MLVDACLVDEEKSGFAFAVPADSSAAGDPDVPSTAAAANEAGVRAAAAAELDEPSEGGGEFGSVSEVDGAAVGFVFGLVANEVSNGVGGVEDGEEHPGDPGEESGDHAAEGGEGGGVLHEALGGGAGDVLQEKADAGEGDDRE